MFSTLLVNDHMIVLSDLDFSDSESDDDLSENNILDKPVIKVNNDKSNVKFPNKKTFTGKLVENLRYGENPHQKAAIYSNENNLNIKQLHGKKLSFNNTMIFFLLYQFLNPLKKIVEL